MSVTDSVELLSRNLSGIAPLLEREHIAVKNIYPVIPCYQAQGLNK